MSTVVSSAYPALGLADLNRFDANSDGKYTIEEFGDLDAVAGQLAYTPASIREQFIARCDSSVTTALRARLRAVLEDPATPEEIKARIRDTILTVELNPDTATANASGTFLHTDSATAYPGYAQAARRNITTADGSMRYEHPLFGRGRLALGGALLASVYDEHAVEAGTPTTYRYAQIHPTVSAELFSVEGDDKNAIHGKVSAAGSWDHFIAPPPDAITDQASVGGSGEIRNVPLGESQVSVTANGGYAQTEYSKPHVASPLGQRHSRTSHTKVESTAQQGVFGMVGAYALSDTDSAAHSETKNIFGQQGTVSGQLSADAGYVRLGLGVGNTRGTIAPVGQDATRYDNVNGQLRLEAAWKTADLSVQGVAEAFMLEDSGTFNGIYPSGKESLTVEWNPGKWVVSLTGGHEWLHIDLAAQQQRVGLVGVANASYEPADWLTVSGRVSTTNRTHTGLLADDYVDYDATLSAEIRVPKWQHLVFRPRVYGLTYDYSTETYFQNGSSWDVGIQIALEKL